MLMLKQRGAIEPTAPLPSGAQFFGDQQESLECLRSVHLGNLPADATETSILNLVTTGLVENMNYISHKHSAYISFLNYSAASDFVASLVINGAMVDGKCLDIALVRAPPLSKEVERAVRLEGACRNVYIGNLPASITEKNICEALGSVGIIETVKINHSSRIAFAHFLSISSAIKATHMLRTTAPWCDYKISYGKDRCFHFTRLQRQTAANYFGVSSKLFSLNNISNEEVVHALAQQSLAAISVTMVSGGPQNVGNRSVLLSELPVDVELDEICNATRGGILEKIEYNPAENTCVVTFIDPIATAQFFALWRIHTLSIRRHDITVSWARYSGPLSPKLIGALNHGATRNVYLGRIPENLTKEQLYEDFGMFGEIEQINFLTGRMCAFVNFTNIRSAIRAVEEMSKSSKYSTMRVRFGKDRCGRQPRLFCGGRLTEDLPLGWVLLDYLNGMRHASPALVPPNIVPCMQFYEHPVNQATG